jgi:hypothetical protein
MPRMAEDQHLHYAAKPSRQSLVILTIHSTRRPGALDNQISFKRRFAVTVSGQVTPLYWRSTAEPTPENPSLSDAPPFPRKRLELAQNRHISDT